ncbi:histidinol-phosphate transaminase [Candidatus Xiphinematobacter sp. Idaho Grape]|uniref:histidinol-phosphate transaminase n=1 Tax=Candidatus Xiphinematobacter sp. Idaho Grape TaxID=1704307 RepID=UPI0009E7DB84|nr:histidinol-phosphate transaminase [Candidatus Xiphinematobacter sp. Idaho Grape]
MLRCFISLMRNSVRSHILNLVAYEPGKPIEELAREIGSVPEKILKLASNENPLGPSPKALGAMWQAMARSHLYPDGGGFSLREAIATRCSLATENVVLGNGSNEIIELCGHAFLRPGDEVITAQYSFAIYALVAGLFGANTVQIPSPEYSCDLEAMYQAVTPHTRQLCIVNPNNPTGTTVTQEEIDSFMNRVPGHVLVIFDEAYREFLDSPPDILRYIRENRNVVIMRTFSKAYGLANLRIGYGLAPVQVAKVLQRIRQPFNVNGIAQTGALAALGDEEHIRATYKLVCEGRSYLQEQFGALGLRYIPSQANFILVHTGRSGEAVFHALLQRGIIIRAMRSYMLPEWIRISVGTPEQNRRLVGELKKVLQFHTDC